MMIFNKLKNTDAIWLPKIPEHWELVKVRHLFKESTKKGFPNETLLVASQEHGVVSKDTYGKRTVEATKDFHNLKLVEKGDFVISLRSFQGGIELAHERGIISPAYTILKETTQIDKRYFKNLFKSSPFISLMTLCVKGIREGQNIDYPTFKNEYLPLPPIDEQNTIAEYLDKQNSKIDKLVRNKERLIKVLEEKIYFLVNDDKNWIQDKAKWIFEEVNIKNQNNEELLAVTQDKGVIPKSMCEENFVSPNSFDGLKLVEENDFVISLRSFQGGIEISNYRGIVSPAYNVIRLKEEFSNEIYLAFYKYFFKSPKLISLLNTVISGIRDGQNINWKDFKNLNLPIPNEKSIREMLVDFKAFEELKRTFSKEKIKIKEYREALITDLVTGKWRVSQVEKILQP